MFSPAKSSSAAVNLSGTQDPSRSKNIVKPLALSVQLVGKAFAAGMALLSKTSESQENRQLNSQEKRVVFFFGGKGKGKHSLAFSRTLIFLQSLAQKFFAVSTVPKVEPHLGFQI